jgi:hypothetical protein
MRASAKSLLPVPQRHVCVITTTHGHRRSNDGPLGDLEPTRLGKPSGWTVFGGFQRDRRVLNKANPETKLRPYPGEPLRETRSVIMRCMGGMTIWAPRHL